MSGDDVVVVREAHTLVVSTSPVPVVSITAPGPQGVPGAPGPTLGVPIYVQEGEPPGPAVWFQTDALGRVIDVRTVDA